MHGAVGQQHFFQFSVVLSTHTVLLLLLLFFHLQLVSKIKCIHSFICIHFWALFLHIHSFARTLEVDANIVPQSRNKHLTDSYVYIHMYILFTEVLHKG